MSEHALSVPAYIKNIPLHPFGDEHNLSRQRAKTAVRLPLSASPQTFVRARLLLRSTELRWCVYALAAGVAGREGRVAHGGVSVSSAPEAACCGGRRRGDPVAWRSDLWEPKSHTTGPKRMRTALDIAESRFYIRARE